MADKVSLILACTIDGGIGYENKIPWKISDDLKKFRQITTRTHDNMKMNAVLMGRNTWESLPKHLPNRLNIVITQNGNTIDDPCVLVFVDIESALRFCEWECIETVFVIGGAQIYNTFLSNIENIKINKIYLTIMFYEASQYKMDTYVSMASIWKHFVMIKDYRYEKEKNERSFASYICEPKVK